MDFYQSKMSKKKTNNRYRQENQFYFHKQCWSSNSSDSKEEFQHSNFGHARFSQRTNHYPNWKFDSSDSSDSDDFSKAVWDE